MWKEYFYYSRTERQGIIVLVVLIAIVFGTACYLPTIETSSQVNNQAFEKEYTDFIASIQERKQERRERYTTNSYQRQITLAPFDPNTADSLTFLSLGIPSWMAKNILHYRAKGGLFRQPESFRKVYGLTQEQYTTLLPYIHIAATTHKRDTIKLLTQRAERDTLHSFKYPMGTIINLNSADTTELKKIPGIGSGIAKMIVAYRSRLGGFYEVAQLQDIDLMVDQLHQWLSVGSQETKKININTASTDRLRAHPYLNFYQAKAITEHRKKRGNLKNMKPLALYEEFTENDFERLKHYLCFE